MVKYNYWQYISAGEFKNSELRTLDQTMSMQPHVNYTSSSVEKYCLHTYASTLTSMTDCIKIVHALVTSRLDYANVLMYGLSSKTTNVLRRVQNCAARLITRYEVL